MTECRTLNRTFKNQNSYYSGASPLRSQGGPDADVEHKMFEQFKLIDKNQTYLYFPCTDHQI